MDTVELERWYRRGHGAPLREPGRHWLDVGAIDQALAAHKDKKTGRAWCRRNVMRFFMGTVRPAATSSSMSVPARWLEHEGDEGCPRSSTFSDQNWHKEVLSSEQALRQWTSGRAWRKRLAMRLTSRLWPRPSAGWLRVGKLNVEENGTVPQDYGITAMPTPA